MTSPLQSVFLRLRPAAHVLTGLMLAGCAGRPAGPGADELILSGIAKAEQQQDPAGAIADFNRALALRPDDADGYFNLGVAKNAQHDFPGAIAAFDRAVALNPTDAEAFLSRGEARFSQQKYDAAIADYDHALVLNPRLIAAIYARALAQRRRGNYDEAFAGYGRALELDPNYWLAYNGRATTHNAHGEFALAIADYEQRIRLRPEGAEYAEFQRNLLRQRLGQGTAAELAPIVAAWPEGWPKTVGQYLLGRMDARELLLRAAMTMDGQTRREQRCEASYYVGITALLAGRRAEAREKFLECRATGVNVFLEYLLAGSELARMSRDKPGL